MFAVQDSEAADRFGSEAVVPNYVDYWFTKEYHLKGVIDELRRIHRDTPEILAVHHFMENNYSYTDEKLAEATKIPMHRIRHVLSEYADYKLGYKIAKCLIQTGECSFTAEL